jgi:hypothetical protein
VAVRRVRDGGLTPVNREALLERVLGWPDERTAA